MQVKFKRFGAHLDNRFNGGAVRDEIVKRFKDENRLLLDFEGIETVSNSFADESYAKLALDFDVEEIKRKTEFVNASPFIRVVFGNALRLRTSSLRRKNMSSLDF
jgi:hypothetical protein